MLNYHKILLLGRRKYIPQNVKRFVSEKLAHGVAIGIPAACVCGLSPPNRFIGRRPAGLFAREDVGKFLKPRLHFKPRSQSAMASLLRLAG